MKKRAKWIRLVSFILCVGMILTLLPATVLATDGTEGTAGQGTQESGTLPPAGSEGGDQGTLPPTGGEGGDQGALLLTGSEGGASGDAGDGKRDGVSSSSTTKHVVITLYPGSGAFADGSAVKTLHLSYDTEAASGAALPGIAKENTPECSGMIFNGYTGYVPGELVSADASYTATFAKKCTVTFSAGTLEQGAIISGNDRVREMTVSVKEGASAPAAPKIDANAGYRFDRWNNGYGENAITEDVTFTAQYTPCEYRTFTFHAGEGGAFAGGAAEKTVKVNVGDNLPAAPAVTDNVGYRFTGFTGYTAGTAVTLETADASFTAAYEPVPTSTVTFSAGAHGKIGGETSVSFTRNEGSPMPAAPTDVTPDTDYFFDGFTGYPGESATVGADDVTYTAAYHGIFTITFDAGGFGQFEGGATTQKIEGIAEGSAMPAKPVPVAEAGYVFDGYTGYSATATVTKSQIFVAAYTVKDAAAQSDRYRITGADSVGINESIQLGVEDAEGKAVTENVIWSLSDLNNASIDGSGKLTGCLGGSVIVTAKIGGEAAYKTVVIRAYTVSLYSNFPTGAEKFAYNGAEGGKIVAAENTYAVMQFAPGETYSLGNAAFNCTNFRLTGWNTAANGSGESYAPNASLAVNENYMLFAQWAAIDTMKKVNVTVTYYEGETLKKTQTTQGVRFTETVDNGDGTTGSATKLRVLLLKNQEVYASRDKLIGWTLSGSGITGRTAALGELAEITVTDAAAGSYAIRADARYETEAQQTYPATFYVLKRTLANGTITDASNYYYVGMGTVKTDADGITTREDGAITENHITDLANGNVTAYIDKAPDAAQIASYLNESVDEIGNIRWYKVQKSGDGWHVDGMLYIVGRYWNVKYVDYQYDKDNKTGSTVVRSQVLVRDGEAFDLAGGIPEGYLGGKDNQAKGWFWGNTKIDKNKTYVETVSSDITVYVRYNNLYSVTYNILNDANFIESSKVLYAKGNDKVPEYTPENIPGYKFSGWYCDKALTEPFEQDNMGNRNHMAYGKYIANKIVRYTIKFLYEPANDGEPYEEKRAINENAPVGSIVKNAYLDRLAAQNTLRGYTLDAANSDLADFKLTDDKDSNVINIRYLRNTHKLTVNYLLYGAGTPLADAYTADLRFGGAYSVASPAITGHTLRAGEPAVVTGAMGDADIVVNVYYDVNVHSVTYFVNGVETWSRDYTYGQSVLAKQQEPAAAGYTYTPWAITDGAGKTVAYPATMPDYDIELRTTGSLNAHKVSYFVDGQPYASKTYSYGAPVDAKLNYEKEGYTVSAWTVQDGAGNSVAYPASMPDYDVNLYCTTSIRSYTIEYYVGGVKTGATDTYQYGANVSNMRGLPAAETGFDFGTAWVVTNADDHSSVGYPATMPAYNIRLDLSKTVRTHTITYLVDGKPYDAGALDGSFDFGASIALAAEPTQAYAAFSGWTIHGGGGTLPAMPATMPDYDLEISGTFTPDTYYVTYLVRQPGAATYTTYGAVDSYTVGAAIAALRGEPAAVEGYTFSGWAIEQGGKTLTALPATMPEANIVVRGEFTPNIYKIRYFLNGEPYTPAEQERAFQTALSLLALPGTENGKFAVTGWTVTAGEASAPAYAGTTMPAYDLNAYATKVQVFHTLNIDYVVSGGNGTAPEDVSKRLPHGTAYGIDSPELPGYTCDTATVAGTLNADADVTVTYTPIPYTVRYLPGEKGAFRMETYEERYYGDTTPAFAGKTESADAGFYFTGWQPKVETLVSGSVDYVAQWAPVNVIRLYARTVETTYTGVEQQLEGFEPANLPVGPNGETISVALTGVSAKSTGTGVGDYATVFAGQEQAKVLVDGVEDAQGMYAVEFVPGALTVNPARLIVTANGGTKVAGAADPAFTATFRFVDPVVETANDFAHLVTRVDAGNNVVGAYAVNVTMDTALYKNFAITLVPGTFTITPLPTYTLTFIVSGGPYGGGTIVSQVDTYNAGDAIAPIADIEADGFTFSGWDAMPATMPANDLIVRGTLTAIPAPEPEPGPQPEPEPELIPVEDEPVALAGEGRAWALLNLLLTVATAIGSALMLAGYAGKKQIEADGSVVSKIKKKGRTRLFSIVPTVGAIVAFILTENIKNPMVFTDQWTLLMAVIAVVQLGVAIFARKKEEKLEDAASTETI